jgi:hypothetical protein
VLVEVRETVLSREFCSWLKWFGGWCECYGVLLLCLMLSRILAKAWQVPRARAALAKSSGGCAHHHGCRWDFDEDWGTLTRPTNSGGRGCSGQRQDLRPRPLKVQQCPELSRTKAHPVLSRSQIQPLTTLPILRAPTS